jgi:hypothetical protein
VLGRQQLFTENTLTPILPLLHNRDLKTLGNVLRLWGVVLAANIIGTAAVAAVLAHATMFGSDVHAAFMEISRASVSTPFGTTVLRAIFAGWLIALMVWLLPAADSARGSIIVLITYVVAIGSFAHIIAGSIDAFYLVHTGAIDLDRPYLLQLQGRLLASEPLRVFMDWVVVPDSGQRRHEHLPSRMTRSSSGGRYGSASDCRRKRDGRTAKSAVDDPFETLPLRWPHRSSALARVRNPFDYGR